MKCIPCWIWYLWSHHLKDLICLAIKLKPFTGTWGELCCRSWKEQSLQMDFSWRRWHPQLVCSSSFLKPDQRLSRKLHRSQSGQAMDCSWRWGQILLQTEVKPFSKPFDSISSRVWAPTVISQQTRGGSAQNSLENALSSNSPFQQTRGVSAQKSLENTLINEFKD